MADDLLQQTFMKVHRARGAYIHTGKVNEQVDEPRHAPALAQRVLIAIEPLPDQRAALVLTKLNGKSVAEAAQIAGTAPGAMKLRAHRAYVALRKKFSSMAGGDESWSRKRT